MKKRFVRNNKNEGKLINNDNSLYGLTGTNPSRININVAVSAIRFNVIKLYTFFLAESEEFL